MGKKRLFAFMAMFMMAVVGVGFASCGDDDDEGGVGLSDEEIAVVLQGTWDVVGHEDGETSNAVWTFNGNTLKAWDTGTFSVENGRIVSKVALDGYWITLIKISSDHFEGYWAGRKDYVYVGTKRK